jgi:hypothetical protein
VTRVSQSIDRIDATFDDPNLVANAGLLVVATLSLRLGIESLVNATVNLAGRVGGSRPGRKVLTLVHAMVALEASHIDHVEVLRAGATAGVVAHRVMAPSTVGTFLRAFTFGHVRQLEAVIGRVLERAWGLGAGPGDGRLVIDIDSTICEVHGHAKAGAGYGYTKVLGYHPLLAARADTGEILHARLRLIVRGRGVVDRRGSRPMTTKCLVLAVVLLEDGAAGCVVGVVAVGGGHQHAGVDDEHAQARPKPSASISSASRAVRPELDAPIAANAR